MRRRRRRRRCRVLSFYRSRKLQQSRRRRTSRRRVGWRRCRSLAASNLPLFVVCSGPVDVSVRFVRSRPSLGPIHSGCGRTLPMFCLFKIKWLQPLVCCRCRCQRRCRCSCGRRCRCRCGRGRRCSCELRCHCSCHHPKVIVLMVYSKVIAFLILAVASLISLKDPLAIKAVVVAQ